MEIFRLLVLAVAAAFSFANSAHGVTQDATPQPAIGADAPEFSFDALLKAPDTVKLDLKSLRGRVVVIEFWATWCGPCIPALDHLEHVRADLGDDQVVFLAIARDDRSRLEKYLEKRQTGLWMACDEDGSTSAAYGVVSIPTTVVVDKNGKVAAYTRPEHVTLEALRRISRGESGELPCAQQEAANIDWAPTQTADGEQYATVVISESTATGGGARVMPGSGVISGDGLYRANLIELAYQVPLTRLIDGFGAMAPSDPKYKVYVKAPAGDDQLARDMLAASLRAKLGLVARWDEREVDSLFLRMKEGATPWPVSAAPPSERVSSANGGGIKGVGCKIEYLRSWCENLCGKVVVDETGMNDFYDFEMHWVDGKTFKEALDRAGLKLERGRSRQRMFVVEPKLQGE